HRDARRLQCGCEAFGVMQTEDGDPVPCALLLDGEIRHKAFQAASLQGDDNVDDAERGVLHAWGEGPGPTPGSRAMRTGGGAQARCTIVVWSKHRRLLEFAWREGAITRSISCGPWPA